MGLGSAAPAFLTVDETVATLTLNRLERLNAIDLGMARGLEQLASGLAAAATKALLRQSRRPATREQLQAELHHFLRCMRTKPFRAAAARFMARP